jgi:heme/copper-type cytochrome/quinol oxidase subunit 4
MSCWILPIIIAIAMVVKFNKNGLNSNYESHLNCPNFAKFYIAMLVLIISFAINHSSNGEHKTLINIILLILTILLIIGMLYFYFFNGEPNVRPDIVMAVFFIIVTLSSLFTGNTFIMNKVSGVSEVGFKENPALFVGSFLATLSLSVYFIARALYYHKLLKRQAMLEYLKENYPEEF